MIKLKSILNEIGEGSAKPYPLRINHRKKLSYGRPVVDYDYRWSTKSGYLYSLEIISIGGKMSYGKLEDTGKWVVNFGPMKMGKQYYGIDGRPIGSPQKKMDTEIQTNRGELFSIMATIVKAMKDFIKKAKKSEWGLEEIHYEAAKSQGDAKSDSQRNKLYLAYIKKHLPGVRLHLTGDNKARIRF